MNTITKLFSAALLSSCISSTAFAVDSFSFELGRGDDSTGLIRAGVQWDWGRQLLSGGNWFLGGYWDASVGYWATDNDNDGSNDIADLGFTPVFRLQQITPGSVSPYIEAAIGAHLISEDSLNDDRKFGSNFTFGDHLGFGARFGQGHKYDLGYRYQHLSNAGIASPNDGINFHQIRFAYHFN